MLEKIDLSLSVPKEVYRKRINDLQDRLYDLVHASFRKGIPTMIVFEGWASAGKGSTINVLSERIDPRGMRVVPISPPRTTEMHYPWMWRFWQRIPAHGQTVIFDTSWYRRVLIDRVSKAVKKRHWQGAYQDIVEFESMLAAEGMLIRKFWLHISEKEQGKRFRKLLDSKLTSWQVTDEDRAQHRSYGRYYEAVEEMLSRTDFPHAPWAIIEATDRYHTRIRVFEEIIRAYEDRLHSDIPHARTRGVPSHLARVPGAKTAKRKAP